MIIKLPNFEFPKARKERHVNYVNMRVYDLCYEVSRITGNLDNIDKLKKYSNAKNKDRAIINDIIFKLSLIQKYQRYLESFKL